MNNEALTLIITSSLLLGTICLVALVVMKDVFKNEIEIDVNMEDKNRLPRWFIYSYYTLLGIAIVGDLIFHLSGNVFLFILLFGQIIISIKVLIEVKERKQKYLRYMLITLYLIGIAMLIAIEIIEFSASFWIIIAFVFNGLLGILGGRNLFRKAKNSMKEDKSIRNILSHFLAFTGYSILFITILMILISVIIIDFVEVENSGFYFLVGIIILLLGISINPKKFNY